MLSSQLPFPTFLREMDYRLLGGSGLKVSSLCFGLSTFGGGTEFFRAWGSTGVEEGKRLVGLCLDAGINVFDTADVYSNGLSEEVFGQANQGRRDELLISTKATSPFGKGPSDVGSSRYHLIQACEGSLKRLGTDYIDIYHMHTFDAPTPVEEVLYTSMIWCAAARSATSPARTSLAGI